MTDKHSMIVSKAISRPFSAITKAVPSIGYKQSPKISSTKFRSKIQNEMIQSQKIKPKKGKILFSLLDVNDKITNKRGTELPGQYERRSETETNQILHGRDPKQIKPTIGLRKEKRVQSAYPGRCTTLQNDNEKKDAYLPEGFAHYKQLIVNPRLITEDLAKRYKFYQDKLYNKSIKEIKTNSLSSDIFMRFPEKGAITPHKEPTNNLYMSSDVFYLNKNVGQFEIQKSGEKYFFNSAIGRNKYTGVRESRSEWGDKRSSIIKIKNLPSTIYNILAPNAKGICKTPGEMNQPHNRTKALSEFIDLTRVPAPNYNPDYQNQYKDNQNTFRKIHGMCSDYYDSYGQGKSVYTKPFVKEEMPNLN